MYGLDPAHFLSAPRLAWQAVLKNTKVKLDLLTEIDILLIVEKSVRGGICDDISMRKLIINIMKYYSKYEMHEISNDT